ncbi:alpha/beta hydrolase family protein [Sphingosinicella rhizophila]|uniref:S9 family peptidase n=1 Tax=Sphingosinicella rhizophila TaxID=3050082 RepID=A0ABU3QA67_9SPHN|nr:S9 family peptidase [Sphingosinicella sp. GR2756]MDT9600296.1 S9 family peptidase [Sphingosinicella sp. GR2756]
MVLPSVASADNEEAKKFGARATIEHASLSPDGALLAYLQPTKGQGSGLYVVPLDGSAKPALILRAEGDPERLGYCKWVAAARLVCNVYGITQIEGGHPAYISRLIAVDADGKNMKMLFDRGGAGQALGYKLFGGRVIDWLPDEDGKVLMMREFVPETSTATHLAQTDDGIGVVKVDTRNLSTTPVERPKNAIAEFIADGRGKVRIQGTTPINASGYQRGETRYAYRTSDSRDWKPLSIVTEAETSFNPYAVDPDLDVAYGLQKLDGRRAAYKVALDGSLKQELVFAHPDVDVDGFVHIGRRGRVIGVTYATDRREALYFDPELDKLATSLAKAIPDLPLIRFVDSTVDEKKLLIWAGSDTNPGRYYLFDRVAKQLRPLFDARAELENAQLAPVKAMTYRAADGTMIPAYLTLPPGKTSARGLPALVLPHGGPEARDEWGFDWLSQYFAARGFAVLQPNFRGSAGYGDTWFRKNGFQNWKTAIGDIDDGGRWLISEGVDPGKLAILGWSYGGYAALQSAVAEPGLFKAVIAVAPVTDLNMLKEERQIWSDYRVVGAYVGDGPHIEQGSPARHAGDIKAPVLMFHGSYDRNVGVYHSRVMADRLKDAGANSQYVEYPKLDHYLEDSDARIDMLARSDAFLRASLGLN